MNCSICLELIDNETITTTSCNHTFHKQCLKKWFKFDKSYHDKGWGRCPLCRRDSFDDNGFDVKPTLFRIIAFNLMRMCKI